ncbi:MAG: SRPBCC domain-containing protein [Cyclobacteriaceae bacterium]
MGDIVKEKQIYTEIEIDATPEQVWDVLIDLQHWQDWNPFIVSSEGKAEEGRKIKNTMVNGDKRMVFKPKVLTVDKYKEFKWQGHLLIPGLFDGMHKFEIQQTAGGKVRVVQSEQFKGILTGMVLKRIGDETISGFKAMNAALKERVEAEISQ